MRTGLIGSRITVLRALELIGGVSVILITLLLYMYLSVEDASNHVKLEPSTSAMAFLILIVPAIVGALGCYIHSVRRKNWALALVFVAGMFNLFFVVASAG